MRLDLNSLDKVKRYLQYFFYGMNLVKDSEIFAVGKFVIVTDSFWFIPLYELLLLYCISDLFDDLVITLYSSILIPARLLVFCISDLLKQNAVMCSTLPPSKQCV